MTILPRMHKTARKHLTTFFKFAIPAAIVAYLVWRIEPEQWHQLAVQPKRYELLAAALVIAMLALSTTFARWVLLVRCQGIELGMVEGLRLGAICFLLSFISAGSIGGDLFKAVFLARRRPGKRVAAVASVIVDRACGLYGLIVVVGTALLWLDPSQVDDSKLGIQQIQTATIVLMTLGTAVLLLLVFGGKSVDRIVQSASRLPLVGSTVGHLGPPLRMFHHHRMAFAISLLMSVAVHVMFVFSIYLIARGLFSHPPTLANHFVIVPVGLLVTALPISPAGIGLLELALEALYRAYQQPSGTGTLVALVFEVVRVIMAAIGTVFYWTANDEVRESLEIAESETESGTGHFLEDAQ